MEQYYTLIQTVNHYPLVFYSPCEPALEKFRADMEKSFEAAHWIKGKDYEMMRGENAELSLENLICVMPNIYVKKVIE